LAFSYAAAPAGEAWVALGSSSLQPWAALAAGRSRCWRREPRDIFSFTAVQEGWQRDSMRSLTGQQDNMGRARCGAKLKL